MDLPFTAVSTHSRHPLFYYQLFGNPFLPLHSRPDGSPSPISPTSQACCVTTATSSSIMSAIDSTPTNPSMNKASSNFSINKILETPERLLSLPSPSTPVAASALELIQRAGAVPVSVTNSMSAAAAHKNILDTAKMLWLQQMAYSSPQSPHNTLLKTTMEQKRAVKRRKLGRNPRIPFTQQQIDCLEKKYSCSRYLSSLDVVGLSKELELSEARVKIWFQNRRARERRDKRLETSPSIHNITSDLLRKADSPPMSQPPGCLWGLSSAGQALEHLSVPSISSHTAQNSELLANEYDDDQSSDNGSEERHIVKCKQELIDNSV